MGLLGTFLDGSASQKWILSHHVPKTVYNSAILDPLFGLPETGVLKFHSVVLLYQSLKSCYQCDLKCIFRAHFLVKACRPVFEKRLPRSEFRGTFGLGKILKSQMKKSGSVPRPRHIQNSKKHWPGPVDCKTVFPEVCQSNFCMGELAKCKFFGASEPYLHI